MDDIQFENVVALTQQLIRIPSPNPDGDVSEVARFLWSQLTDLALEPEWIEPSPGRVNIVCSADGDSPGPHVIMNAHLDVFPVEGVEGWSDDPLSGAVRDGRLWGRGANDMKSGVAAFVEVFRSLAADTSTMGGRLTLMLVCDEETFGEWGSRWLLDNRTDLIGDVLLSTEPSGLGLIRTAERGMVWLEVSFRGKGGHGAHPVREVNALARARQFMDLVDSAVAGTSVSAEAFIIPSHERPSYDANMGEGSFEHVKSVTANFGHVVAGVKVNMQPASAVIRLDVRVPPGISAAAALERLRELAGDLNGRVEVMNFIEPNVTAPTSDLVEQFKREVVKYTGRSPVAGPSPGCSDARLWRQRGVPAIGFGPYPHGMGAADEYCDLHELEVVTRVHHAFVQSQLFARRSQ